MRKFAFVFFVLTMVAGCGSAQTSDVASPESVAALNLATWEVEVLRDNNFRTLIGVQCVINKARYRDATTTEAICVAAAKGMAGALGDKWAEFTPSEKVPAQTAEWRGSDAEEIVTSVNNGDIGWININRFADAGVRQMDTAVTRLAAAKVTKIVVDLRDNHGGSVDVMLDHLCYFVPEGTIVFNFRTRNGDTKAPAQRFVGARTAGVSPVYGDAFRKMPVVCLIDGNTASASEEFAVALRDLRGAKLVGTKTYGKGVVQNVSMFGIGSFRLTVAEVIPLVSKPFDGVGLSPDVLMDVSGDLFKYWDDVHGILKVVLPDAVSTPSTTRTTQTTR